MAAELLMLANGSEEPLVSGIRHPATIWLMRGSGLRIEEALAVQKSCFRDGGTVLRIFEQANRDGVGTRPLKHRRAGEYRDTPVPGYLWDMVNGLPGGYFFVTDGKLPTYTEIGLPGSMAASHPSAVFPSRACRVLISCRGGRGYPVAAALCRMGASLMDPA